MRAGYTFSLSQPTVPSLSSVLGGQLRPDNLVLWNFVPYHSGLAKLWPQIKDLPLGTEVVARPADEPSA